MNITELSTLLDAKVLSGSEEAMGRAVTGGYCGDLLSWVMGRAQEGGAWITIMSNANVAAVAHLADVACVVFAEGVEPDGPLLDRAQAEDIPLLSSQSSAFELSGRLYRALNP